MELIGSAQPRESSAKTTVQLSWAEGDGSEHLQKIQTRPVDLFDLMSKYVHF